MLTAGGEPSAKVMPILAILFYPIPNAGEFSKNCPLQIMKELDIKVGYECNNNCVFCLNRDKRYFKEYPIETLKNQITVSAQGGCQKLIISGGEPLISKYFWDLLNFAKEKGIKRIEIQTNGRMLYYEELVQKLKQFEPIEFLVSLHFPNSKLYKKYCQSEGFPQVVKGIKNLIKHNFNFTVNTVIMKPNLPHLKDMVVFLKKLGVKNIQYRFIDGKNVMDNYQKFVPKFSQCLPIIRKIIKKNPGLAITLNEIPICVLGEEFKKNLAPINPTRTNLSIKNRVLNSREIWKTQFVYPNCKNCRYRPSCRGVRKEYCRIYGTKEFKPISY